MGPTTGNSARREAASWYARLQSPECEAAERREFETWRAVPANAAAYEEVLHLLGDVAMLAAADERLRELPVPAAPRRRKSRWQVPAAVAAGIVAAVWLGGWVVPRATNDTAEVFYATSSNRPSEHVLDDGSIVHLDVRSEVRVRMSPQRRDIELLRGRAVFDVAKDRERPFAVTAGSGVVTALGTLFEVDRRAERVVVTLVEGSVSVADERNSLRLEPGEQLSISQATDEPWQKSAIDAQAETSWLHGRHVFRALPLAEAVREVNTYAAKKVRLGDPSLGALRVSGNFLVGDSTSIAAGFAAVLPLRIRDGGNEIVLYRDYESDDR